MCERHIKKEGRQRTLVRAPLDPVISAKASDEEKKEEEKFFDLRSNFPHNFCFSPLPFPIRFLILEIRGNEVRAGERNEFH